MKIDHAFSSYSANDIAKLKKFYQGTLGLKVEETMGGLQFQLPGVSVFIYPKNNREPATFTVLNLEVDNIDNAVEELVKKGVKFEHYDSPGIETDPKGISGGDGKEGPWGIAWFKDPSGNILALIQS